MGPPAFRDSGEDKATVAAAVAKGAFVANFMGEDNLPALPNGQSDPRQHASRRGVALGRRLRPTAKRCGMRFPEMVPAR